MKRSLLFISALLLGIYIWGGCSKDIKGPARVNQSPTVEFVNIPVEGAKFSSDTAIYWYGTDVDGFIKYYRYAVVADTVVGADPEVYLTQTPDNQIPWVTLTVSLDSTHTKQRIKLPADAKDPVRKYVTSVIFLQAIDNLGAKSPVIYRKFSKNNHFPETTVYTQGITDPYVNAKSSAGVLEGVNISFTGDDRIDYPRNPPPFEFHWKLYGPYDSLTMVLLNHNYVETTFVDIYGDFYHKGDLYRTIQEIDTLIDTLAVPPDTTVDTTFNYILVDTLKTGNVYGSWAPLLLVDSLPDSLNRVASESYDPLSDSYWITETSANIYDVFGKADLVNPVDTTRLQYFMFWCQTRDDSKVPDPIPEYKWITVIDPKFERDVMVLDATPYGNVSSAIMNYPPFPGAPYNPGRTFPPTTPTYVKDVYGSLINGWKPGSFDTSNILPVVNIYDEDHNLLAKIDYPKWKCTQDYYQIGNLKNAPDKGVGSISLRDVLKHKIMIVIKDSPSKQIPLASLEGAAIINGISAGMSAWVMSRGSFTSNQKSIGPMPSYAVSNIYRAAFGIDAIKWTGWIGMDIYFPSAEEDTTYGAPGQIRIEDFIGAYSLKTDFPNIDIDTTLLETRYHWFQSSPLGNGIFEFPFRCPGTGAILIGGLPEVGYVEKSTYAEALYLYKSLYGTRTPKIEWNCNVRTGNIEAYEGAVVAVRYNTPLFRTSHFCFSMLPYKESDVQGMFNQMMDWLSVQPFIQAGKMSSSATAPLNVEELRAINRELHELKVKGLLRSMSESE